jgi:hypothetical protein
MQKAPFRCRCCAKALITLQRAAAAHGQARRRPLRCAKCCAFVLRQVLLDVYWADRALTVERVRW